MCPGVILLMLAGLATARVYSAGEDIHLKEDRSSAKFLKVILQVCDSLDCLKDILTESLYVSEKTSVGMDKLTDVTKQQLDEHKGVMTDMKKDLQQVLMLTQEIKNSERTCNCDKTELEQVSAENEQLKVTVANRDKQVEELTAEIEKLKINNKNTEIQLHQLRVEVESKHQANLQCSSELHQRELDLEFEKQKNHQCLSKVQQFEEELEESKKENQQYESKVQQLTKDIESKRLENQEVSLKVFHLNETLEQSDRREAELKATVKQLDENVTSLNKIVEEKVCRQKEAIKKLVHKEPAKTANKKVQPLASGEVVLEFKGTKDWKVLKEGLQQLLESSSEEYQQLQQVVVGYDYPLFTAGMNGHVKLLSLLLDADFPTDMLFSIQGDTLLHLAAYNNHLQLVRLLIIHGADIDVRRMTDGFTPLMWAADRGYVELARLFVRAGADISIKNSNGQTALDRARTNGKNEVVQFMESLQC